MEIKNTNYIYFIQRVDGIGPIKIGTSTNPNKRLAGIQTSNPYRLRIIKLILGGLKVEHNLHTKFKEYRMEGEWFKPDNILLQFIKECSPVYETVYTRTKSMKLLKKISKKSARKKRKQYFRAKRLYDIL